MCTAAHSHTRRNEISSPRVRIWLTSQLARQQHANVRTPTLVAGAGIAVAASLPLAIAVGCARPIHVARFS